MGNEKPISWNLFAIKHPILDENPWEKNGYQTWLSPFVKHEGTLPWQL